MRKLVFIIIAITLFCSGVAEGRGKFFKKIVARRLDRNATENTGPEPDYGNLFYWAASPFKEDASDSIPDFLKSETRDTRADVFFIHPTSFFGEAETAAWNADLTDTIVNNETDSRSILFQATVFNGSCRVFAPRDRQANM